MATETHFHKELDELKENLLMMAALVEGAIRDALQSLVKRDSELAKKTFEGEDRINAMEFAGVLVISTHRLIFEIGKAIFRLLLPRYFQKSSFHTTF